MNLTYRFSTTKGIIARKAIHLATVIVPLYYIIYDDKPTLLSLLFPLTALFLLAEAVRLYIKPVGRIFLRLLSPMLWKEEEREFLGATRWLISASIVCGYFPKDIAVLVLLFVSISDTLAYTIGQFWWKKEIVKGKTLGGGVTFFVSAIIIAYFSPLPIPISIVGALIATLVEHIPKYDDNWTIPIITGITLWIITRII